MELQVWTKQFHGERQSSNRGEEQPAEMEEDTPVIQTDDRESRQLQIGEVCVTTSGGQTTGRQMIAETTSDSQGRR